MSGRHLDRDKNLFARLFPYQVLSLGDSSFTMEVWVKLNSSASGRDKVARLVQYGSRAVWYLLEERKKGLDTMEKLKSLDGILSMFRRLMRFGRCVDALYSSLQTIHNPDTILRLTLTLSRISSSLFLLGDHLLWLGKAKFIKIDEAKWTQTSCRYWLYSLVLSLVRDMYEFICIFKEERQGKGAVKCKDVTYVATQCLRNHRAVVLDTVRNLCDISVPLTMLGHTKLSAGTIGVLGVISSLVSLMELINPKLKLTPS